MQQLATGYGLVEGPVWHPTKGLLYSDVLNGGVFALGEDGTISTVVPHRKGIGGIVLHEADGLVVGGRNLSYKSFDGERSVVLLDNDVTEEAVGFNDFTTDAKGRIYAGSLAFKVFGGGEPKPGHLHLVDLDGSVRTLSGGVMLTNGMGFSPDGKKLYHADARGDVIRVYDVAEYGGVGPWRPFVKTSPDSHADGLAVAEDGSVWTAMAHGSRVDVFEPDGSLRKSLPVPLPMVTSVCFGGNDLMDLYVVTGSRGGPSENCGTVYRTRADVPGLPVAESRVRLT
jgi:D-xylonolactonase